MFQVYNKKNFFPYRDRLDNFFQKFRESGDKLSKNYYIDYNELDEITLIVEDDNIVAFASVLQRDIWPQNCRRIFNRMIRNKELPWKDDVFGKLSQTIHDHQMDYLKNTQGVEFAFISREGKKKRYVSEFTLQANQYSPGWIQVNGMIPVCQGKKKNCLQHVMYKSVNGKDIKFDMLDCVIPYDIADKLIEEENLNEQNKS